MKTFQEITLTIRKNRRELEENYGLRKIGVFGSCARNEQGSGSDIDMLVDVKRPMGLIKFMRLEQHLARLLKARVDLVTKKALKPHIGKHILREIRYV